MSECDAMCPNCGADGNEGNFCQHCTAGGVIRIDVVPVWQTERIDVWLEPEDWRAEPARAAFEEWVAAIEREGWAAPRGLRGEIAAALTTPTDEDGETMYNRRGLKVRFLQLRGLREVPQ